MKLTKEEERRWAELWKGIFKPDELQILCADWRAMRAMLEEVGKLLDELQKESHPTQLAYLNGKLKELLG